MNNPRYPCRCVVTREVGGGSYPPVVPDKKTILLSACGFRDETVAEVNGGRIADFKLALPKYITVLNIGDLIKVNDGRRIIKGAVKRDRVSNYGANIWFNEVK